VGFSRGCATAVRLAQLVNERGLVTANGTVVAPPGSVAVTGMELIDPVATGVQGEMGIPPNVKGQVLVVEGNDENRSHFRPLYYGDDPRVTTVQHPGNHVGVGAATTATARRPMYWKASRAISRSGACPWSMCRQS
jgi:hypothetical protein